MIVELPEEEKDDTVSERGSEMVSAIQALMGKQKEEGESENMRHYYELCSN